MLVAVGLTLYVTGGSLALTLTGILVAAAGGSFCLVGANAFMPDHQGPPPAGDGECTPSARSWPARALAVGLGVALTWGWRPALVAAAVGFVVLEVVRGRGVHEYDGATAASPCTPRAKLSGAFWIDRRALLRRGRRVPLTFWGSDLRLPCRDGERCGGCRDRAIVGGLAIGRIIGSRVVARLDAERPWPARSRCRWWGSPSRGSRRRRSRWWSACSSPGSAWDCSRRSASRVVHAAPRSTAARDSRPSRSAP
jgi:hypothetical protein